MAPRMIRVRNTETGQEALVSERAFQHFAGYFERADQAETAASAPAPAVEPDQPKNPVRRAAATTDKEQ